MVKPRDTVESIGEKLMRHVASSTYDLVGDGTSTSIVFAQGLINEGVKAVTTGGADPIEMTKGMERTMRALVKELKCMSRKVKDDYLAVVVKRNTRNNNDIGNVIAKAKSKVGNKGVVALEVGKTKKECLHLVEGLHYGRHHLSPCFVIDSGNKLVEYENCKLLLVDKDPKWKDLLIIFEDAKNDGYPLLIIAEDIQEDDVHTLVMNKPPLKIAILKATGVSSRKMVDDIAILLKRKYLPLVRIAISSIILRPLTPVALSNVIFSNPWWLVHYKSMNIIFLNVPLL
ncbi:hypothetical protein L6452_23590 [Arctium lappa]|uniref:Uncharacterized protein n=1 Tax=Arctium lappa TaxID=4217 RepID=A0ACB9B1U7_ARCLA|nr:hypothetical protein L6452_23590 [Arctium lappa]